MIKPNSFQLESRCLSSVLSQNMESDVLPKTKMSHEYFKTIKQT